MPYDPNQYGPPISQTGLAAQAAGITTVGPIPTAQTQNQQPPNQFAPNSDWRNWGNYDYSADPSWSNGVYNWGQAPEHYGRPWDLNAQGVPQSWEVAPSAGSPFSYNPWEQQWAYDPRYQENPYYFDPYGADGGTWRNDSQYQTQAQDPADFGNGGGNTTATNPAIYDKLRAYADALNAGDQGLITQLTNQFTQDERPIVSAVTQASGINNDPFKYYSDQRWTSGDNRRLGQFQGNWNPDTYFDIFGGELTGDPYYQR